MNSKFKEIYNKIKKFETILVVRHIGPDPDAIASQIGLRDSIKLTFPSKKVYALGASVSKFKFLGKLDKQENYDFDKTLVIALDVPDKGRVDLENFTSYKNIIKIDHHPFVEKFSDLELVEENTSSTAQLVAELILNTHLSMNKDIATILIAGIVSDTNRFLFDNTGYKTLEVVTLLMKKYNILLTQIYNDIYLRPLSEIRLMGFISSNLKVTKNGFAYMQLDEDIVKSLGADISSVSNMINEYNSIKEILVWIFISKGDKEETSRINMRSRGPIINGLAAKYSGGGHKLASGIRNISNEDLKILLEELDELCKNYNKK